MPKVRLTSSTVNPIDVADKQLRKAVASYLIENRGKETRETLAQRVGIARTTFWRKLEDPGTFTVKELRRLAATIGMDAAELQRCVM